LLFEDTHRAIPTHGISEGTGDRLQIIHIDSQVDPKHEVRNRYHMRGPGWVLVRPDQVVAARGEGADLTPLNRYLERVLRIGGAGRSAGPATAPHLERTGGSAKPVGVSNGAERGLTTWRW
jgi:hypothetical protein